MELRDNAIVTRYTLCNQYLSTKRRKQCNQIILSMFLLFFSFVVLVILANRVRYRVHLKIKEVILTCELCFVCVDSI